MRARGVCRSRNQVMPTCDIDGIPVEFPHSAYPCQITYMRSVMNALKNRENALLESPTGTGKTLSLLCAALAWRTAEMGRRQLGEQTASSRSANYDMIMERSSVIGSQPFKSVNSASGSVSRLQSALNDSLNYTSDPIRDDSLSEYLKPPLIIYASRTHSQLTQVIGELRRTTYRPKIAIVGSREQMCIHPNVRELTSSSAQSAVCNRLTKKKMCEFNIRVPEALNHLKRGKEKEQSGEECGEAKIMDMEDLIQFASMHKACPYYTSRELLGEADLVFMPYNYLLDKKTRGSSLLSFKDAIVIFDEAHNVESSCYDAVSCEISSDDLTLAEKELQHCLELVDSQYFGTSLSAGSVNKDTVMNAQRFISTVKANLSRFVIPSQTNFLSQTGDAIFQAFEEGQQVEAESGQVEIDAILGSFEEIVKLYLEDQYNRRSGKKSSFQLIVSALRTIYGMADDNENENGAADDPAAEYAKHSDRLQKRKELIKKSSDYYRMVVSESSVTGNMTTGKQHQSTASTVSTKIRTMAYWCFNPGVVMKELISMGVRSIVLTSGTLSPMKSFMQEMQIDFKHVLENDHVIDDEQVFATVVGTGPSGKSLNSSFNQRDSKDYQQELGLAIVNFCRVIPDGVLVFFPSYQVMDSCLGYWQVCRPGGSTVGAIPGTQTIFQMIQAIKIPIIEPKSKGELTVAMERYERVLEDAKEARGAIFFAVCRGKVSEGLDFADAKGRAVIITGIPYPPFKDPKIILKKQYLQDSQKAAPQSDFLSGHEWYNQQASRAVNQALGRVIRHRKDFGAILLCDERFGNAGTLGQLSKWLRGRVATSASFGEVQGGLARFFKDKPKHLKGSSGASSVPNVITKQPAVQAPSSNKNELLMQKFKLDSGTSNNKTGLTEIFKCTTNAPAEPTKKFDWFNKDKDVPGPVNQTPSASTSFDKEKQQKAKDYLELARTTLPKDDFRNFMGLLKMYRANQIDIETLLTDLVELLKKVPEGGKARGLLEGFEAFVPSKHRSLFDQVLLKNATGLDKTSIVSSHMSSTVSMSSSSSTLISDDEIKKRKLHSDFVGKRPSFPIEPIVLKRKLTTDSASPDTEPHEPCPICKDALIEPSKAKCGHVACFECWNAWLGRTLECPLCRQRTRVSQLRKISEA